VAFVLAADGPGVAQQPATDGAVPAGTVAALGLGDCLRLAQGASPRLAAARASLAAAEDGSRAVNALRVPALIDPELPVRRRQACLGVTAAAAALDQTEREVAYAVTRTYLSVLFARDQEKVARRVATQLATEHQDAKRQLDAGARNVTTTDVNRLLTYARLAEAKQIQAAQGEKRALAALLEAVGRGQDCHIEVPARPLPVPEVRPDRCAVVAAALARRGELVQAGVFAEIAHLEVDAQATSCGLRHETFAAGGDIHARQVPPEVRNGEYRPGAVPPEMPTLLAGSKAERVQRASDLSARADAVVEVTRNLIALDAADAFLRWEEAAGEAAKAREGADAADQMAVDLAAAHRANPEKVRLEEVITAWVLVGTARGQYNEYLYRQLVALADLERATAGGFCAGLAELIAAPAPPEKKPGGDKLFP
jgi:outer membrane protein TolC